jgi:hypothetical protein
MDIWERRLTTLSPSKKHRMQGGSLEMALC